VKKTYELLSEICSANPSMTHLCLRLYKTDKTLLEVEDEAFRYEWISVAAVPQIAEIIADFEREQWYVGLTSMVMTTTGVQHLLMLDYLIDHSPHIEHELALKLAEFSQSGDVAYNLAGWLITTNNSYHYLSKFVTTEENFINFLGSALLFRHSEENNIIDDIWLGRSVKRRFGAIRLGQKEGVYPTVICEVK
jgi:hypothetical protein